MSAATPAAPGPIIELAGLSMRFRHHSVLRDIELAVPRGQTLAVIGESGCGKTVLLKLMIGLLRPSKGYVRFDGRDLSKLGEAELNRTRLRFGFLFQMAALFDSLTIFDNVAFDAHRGRIEPSCRAASASASAWRGRWPSTRR